MAAVVADRRCSTGSPLESRTGIARLVRLHPHRVAAEHVGPVGEEGDAAEALRLALGAEHPARGIEAHQLGVGARARSATSVSTDVRVAGQIDQQVGPSIRQSSAAPAPSTATASGVSPSPSSRSGWRVRAVAPHRQRRADARRGGIELEIERDLRHQPVGRAIILAADHRGRRRRSGGVDHGRCADRRRGLLAMSMRQSSAGASDCQRSALAMASMARLFLFGLGYTAQRASPHALRSATAGTCRGNRRRRSAFDDETAVRAALAEATPCPVLGAARRGRRSGARPLWRCARRTRWLGYLSSTGVYGDTGGAWVDESAPHRRRPPSARDRGRSGLAGAAARASSACPASTAPAAAALDRVRAGQAHRIDLPGQVFSRVHVDDIVAGVIAGAATRPPGVYNLADDLPARQNAVVEYGLPAARPAAAAARCRWTKPASRPPARAFYAENRRVANGKAKRAARLAPALSRLSGRPARPQRDRRSPVIASSRPPPPAATSDSPRRSSKQHRDHRHEHARIGRLAGPIARITPK